MSLLRIATINLLETASSVTDTGTPVADYPITRLFDRSVSREYRITEAGVRDITATGGISATDVNALIIAAGHNIGGLAYTLARSTNGSAWTTVSSGTFPAGSGIIVVEFAAVADAYWKLTLPNDTALTMTEMLLTEIYTFTDQADRDSSRVGTRRNVMIEETPGGTELRILNGPPRRTRVYGFIDVPAAMADEIESQLNALGGVKPFYLCDHRAAWIWGNTTEEVEPQEIQSIGAVRKQFSIDFIEVL